MKTTRAVRALLAIATVAGAAALADCAGEQPEVKYAHGYVPGPHRVSVFGVFKDGRMDSVAWNDFAPKIADELDGPCEPGYGDRLRTADPRLFATIEEQTEQEGVTPSLLDKVASRTDGEFILVLYEYGNPTRPADSANATQKKQPPPATTPQPGQGRGRGRGRGGRQAAPPSDKAGTAQPGFELAASLFDIHEHAFVAEVDIKRAKTADSAVDQLASTFEDMLSGSSCASFDWNKQ